MSEHRVAVTWKGDGQPFRYATYTRNYDVAFKGGATRVTGSAAPDYKGDATRPDPEDMLVAALSACHMLSFLALATKKQLSVESYEDDAVGFLENDNGRLWIARVILRPKVLFAAAPDPAVLAELHEHAHQACFIANSVKTDVRVEPC